MLLDVFLINALICHLTRLKCQETDPVSKTNGKAKKGQVKTNYCSSYKTLTGIKHNY